MIACGLLVCLAIELPVAPRVAAPAAVELAVLIWMI